MMNIFLQASALANKMKSCLNLNIIWVPGIVKELLYIV